MHGSLCMHAPYVAPLLNADWELSWTRVRLAQQSLQRRSGKLSPDQSNSKKKK